MLSSGEWRISAIRRITSGWRIPSGHPVDFGYLQYVRRIGGYPSSAVYPFYLFPLFLFFCLFFFFPFSWLLPDRLVLYCPDWLLPCTLVAEATRRWSLQAQTSQRLPTVLLDERHLRGGAIVKAEEKIQCKIFYIYFKRSLHFQIKEKSFHGTYTADSLVFVMARDNNLSVRPFMLMYAHMSVKNLRVSHSVFFSYYHLLLLFP